MTLMGVATNDASAGSFVIGLADPRKAICRRVETWKINRKRGIDWSSQDLVER